jgi:hypothetical protein
MTAPTEAEIREAIRLRTELFPSDNPQKALRMAIEDFGSFMHGPAYNALENPDPRDEPSTADADDIWTDLRPSEAMDLERLYQEAVELAVHDVELLIARAFTAAALRFVELHPDAPRAVPEREPVTA